jgi:hypothetical protein
MAKPVITVETPPGAAITEAMTLLALVGFALSLRWKEGVEPSTGAAG